MVNSLDQVEKNVSASFGYVKKDILMLNDSYSKLQEAISQIAKSYGVLGDEIKSLKKEIEIQRKKEGNKSSKKVSSKKVVKKSPKRIVKKSSKKATKKGPRKIIKETTVYE